MRRVSELLVSRRDLLELGSVLLVGATLVGCATGEPSSTEVADDAKTDADADVASLPKVAFLPTAENVRLIGRTFEEDGATWLAQSGSAIEFEATGERVVLEVACGEGAKDDPELRPRFAVLVDGEVVVDEVLNESSRAVEVALDDARNGAVVELMLLSEASQGAVGVRGITVEHGVPAAVVPSAEKRLRIGFAGDSITCAYAVESADYDEPFSTATENFMKSYAYLTASELEADYDVVCYSGYGIVSGWTASGERNDARLLPPQYDLVIEGRNETWDFDAHPNDVVVINLGTNDYSYTGSDEARMEEFAQGYAKFLARVRELNPDALIVCTLGTMHGAEVLYPSVERAARDHMDRTGDTRIVCYQSDSIDVETDGVGTNGHPNEVTQRKSAKKLVDVIRNALGM